MTIWGCNADASTIDPVQKGREESPKTGKDLDKLKMLLSLLMRQTPLPEAYQDHPLRGNWKRYRDAHIEPDWLFLYCVVGEELQLAQTGTHADLFQE